MTDDDPRCAYCGATEDLERIRYSLFFVWQCKDRDACDLRWIGEG